MSKIPSFANRSISVREQPAHSSPELRRSTSTYGRTHGAPVEIGSKGSIFSLVDREAASTLSSHPKAETTKASYIWQNRLWIIIPKKACNGSQHQKQVPLQTVEESAQEMRVPKWKRFLRKLKALRGVDKKSNVTKTELSDRTATHPKIDEDGLPSTPLPKCDDSEPPSPIWERRNFAQIKPLDLSHLHTLRIKKEHSKLINGH